MSEPLTAIAVGSVAVAATCAILIVADFAVGYRQPMTVMAVVWPVTALYFGPVGLWAYARWGRPRTERWRAEHGVRETIPGDVRTDGNKAPDHKAPDPAPSVIALADSHCGAGCTLGDILGASVVFALGLEFAGRALWAELVVDFLLAYGLGVVFQYLTIAPMRGLGPVDGLIAALRADTLSLISFEIGLFTWMILLQLVLFGSDPLTPAGVLADDAGGHDPGLRNGLPGQRVAHPARLQGAHVGGLCETIDGRPSRPPRSDLWGARAAEWHALRRAGGRRVRRRTCRGESKAGRPQPAPMDCQSSLVGEVGVEPTRPSRDTGS